MEREQIGKASFGRRDFLKGTVAAAAAVGMGAAAWGCAPQSPSAQSDAAVAGDGAEASPASDDMAKMEELYDCWMPPQGESAFEAEPVTEFASTETWDVVIVGMGAVGSMAAAFAAGAGLKTLVIEKTEVQPMNPADILAVNAKVLQDMGFEAPSYDAYMNSVLTTGNYRVNIPKVATLYQKSGEAFDWIYENAIHPAGITAAPSYPKYDKGMTEGWTPIINSVVNWEHGQEDLVAVHTAVADYAVEHGAEVRFSTPAVQLVQADSGEVTGVVAKNEAGEYVKLEATRGVILATGGYAANMERMKTHMRLRDCCTIAAVQFVNVGVTGDGHEMGLAVGASESEIPQSAAINNYGLVDSHTIALPFLALPWVRVNEKGRRFANEGVPFNFLASAIVRQPRGTCWSLFDGNFVESAKNFLKSPFVDSNQALLGVVTPEFVDQYVQDGVVLKADSLDELAQMTGMDAALLKETCAQVSADAAEGSDPVFGNECLYPLDTPPFYAVHEGTTLLNTCGGLNSDEWGRVMTVEDEVIPGLYAVGDCAGGIWDGGLYTHQCYGADWGSGITFAYLAVQDIVANA